MHARLTVVVSLAIAMMAPTVGSAADAQKQWQDGCANCYGADAAAFAKKELKLVGGKLVMPDSGMSLTTVLGGGHGRLDADAVKAMDAYLLSLVATK
jgi:hypothetical protein